MKAKEEVLKELNDKKIILIYGVGNYPESMHSAQKVQISDESFEIVKTITFYEYRRYKIING